MTALTNQGVGVAISNLEKLRRTVAKLGVVPREEIALIRLIIFIKHTKMEQRTFKAGDIGVPNITSILKGLVGLETAQAAPRDECALPIEV